MEINGVRLTLTLMSMVSVVIKFPCEMYATSKIFCEISDFRCSSSDLMPKRLFDPQTHAQKMCNSISHKKSNNDYWECEIVVEDNLYSALLTCQKLPYIYFILLFFI